MTKATKAIGQIQAECPSLEHRTAGDHEAQQRESQIAWAQRTALIKAESEAAQLCQPLS